MKIELHLLKALIEGVLRPEDLDERDLSKEGRVLRKAVSALLKRRLVPPFALAVVLQTALALGGERKALESVAKQLEAVDLPGAVHQLGRIISYRRALALLIEEAGQQLAEGEVAPERLLSLLDGAEADEKLVPLESLVEAERPAEGPPILSLKRISAAAGGLRGIWVIGGEPGIGKSTLAWQIALDAGRELPVLYYDLDGTGAGWFLHRTERIVGEPKALKRALRQIYYRSTIRTLEADLRQIGSAVVVVDSLQTLPARVEHRRAGIDRWLMRFKELQAKQPVVLVSELRRTNYGQVSQAAYKETGEIEYAGTFCLQLVGDPACPEVHVVKNRYGPERGFLVELERDRELVWWFREIDD